MFTCKHTGNAHTQTRSHANIQTMHTLKHASKQSRPTHVPKGPTYMHIVDKKHAIYYCFWNVLLCLGLWARLWIRGPWPRNHCGQCCIQYVCDHWTVCLGHPRWGVTEDQTPTGIFCDGFLEHLCIHMAVSHPCSHIPRHCGGMFWWCTTNSFCLFYVYFTLMFVY